MVRSMGARVITLGDLAAFGPTPNPRQTNVGSEQGLDKPRRGLAYPVKA